MAVALAAGLLAAPTWAQRSPAAPTGILPPTVAAALRAANIPQSAIALEVRELGAAEPLLAINTRQPMNPASTMKLVTTFAGMELLGPSYTWKTEVWAEGRMLDGVLDGNLILRGGGDPKLTIESLWLLASHVRARGVRLVRGDLLLDRSAFATARFDPASFDNDPTRPYNVGPDALLLNLKTVRFTFVPDVASGHAEVVAEPRMAQLDVAPNVRLSEEACGSDWESHLKMDFQAENVTALRVLISGAYPLSCGEKTWNVSLFSPDAYFEGTFRPIWEELGGSLQGKVRPGIVPPGARLVYVHESPPLAEVVRDINKFSNNVMARQLFLTIGMEKSGMDKTGAGADAAADKPAAAGAVNRTQPPARTDLSNLALRLWLEQRGIELPELVLDNGSGLSRSERITAGGMSRLLGAMYASSVMPEMLASLPIVAVDGTMRRRFKAEGLAGQAHIKTGTLSDVRAIAGFVFAANGRRYSVVFMVNHPGAALSAAAQDAVLRWVYERPSTTP